MTKKKQHKNKLKQGIKLPPYTVENVIFTLSQSQGWGIKQCNIPSTWTVTQGEGKTALIIDTGHPVHIDIGDNAIEGKNFVPKETIVDINGHGTHVAGIVCAQNNEEGMVGVAPKAKCISVKALNQSGSGSFNSIIGALKYALEVKPSVVSMSLGTPSTSYELYDIIKELYNANIPIVCAAGNTGKQGVQYPAKYPETISIAAYDENGNIANFSSVGEEVDWSAPGVDIYSTWLNNGYAKLNGTCLIGETQIYTINGNKNIKDVEIGDLVYSFNEKTQKTESNKIINVWNRGNKKTLKIQTPRTNLICTNNHPILVKDSNLLIWKTADDIKIGDFIVCNNIKLNKDKNKHIEIADDISVKLTNKISLNNNNMLLTLKHDNNIACSLANLKDFINAKNGIKYIYAKSIISNLNIPRSMLLWGSKSTNKKIQISDTVTPELAYLGGFYIGDGWVNRSGKNINNSNSRLERIYFAKTNIEGVNQKLKSVYKKLFEKELKESKNSQYYDDNKLSVSIFSDLFGDNYATDKCIPQWLYNEKESIIYSFISGLIDSDGCIVKACNNAYSYSTSSKKLSEGLKALLDYSTIHRNNGSCRERKLRPPHSKKDIICTTYEIPFYIEPFKLNSYKSNIKTSINRDIYKIEYFDNIRFEPVIKKSTDKIQTVYDIEVENNHNFIANNIIVHNSMACPFITGVILLLLAKHTKQESETGQNDCKTVEEIRQHLLKYTIDKGIIGKDSNWGYGVLDVENMILATNDPNLNLPIYVEPKPKFNFFTWLKNLFSKLW